MAKNLGLIISRLPILLFAALVAGQIDYTQYVNPFIGSEGPFPGLAFGGGGTIMGVPLDVRNVLTLLSIAL